MINNLSYKKIKWFIITVEPPYLPLVDEEVDLSIVITMIIIGFLFYIFASAWSLYKQKEIAQRLPEAHGLAQKISSTKDTLEMNII